MNKLSLLAGLLLIGLIISSCAKLPVNHSKWLKNKSIMEADTGFCTFYDSKSKIRYDVFNDSEFLYIKFDVSNRINQMKILKTGFNIYFDPECKRKENIYLNYPIERSNIPEKPAMRNEFNRKKNDIISMVNQLPGDAIFNNNDKIERFNCKSNTNGVEMYFTADTNNVLYCKMKISLDKICKDRTSFSVGMVSGYFEMPKQQGPPGGGGQRQGNGQRQGGGVGQQSGGMRPGGKAYENRSGVNSAMTEPIRIWFILNLAIK